MVNIRKAINHLKNIPGINVNGKYLMISCDDFGSIRLRNRESREILKRQGLRLDDFHFDQYDCLEQKEDWDRLEETLTVNLDSEQNPAKISGFFVTRNIDFEATRDSGYYKLFTELCNETYRKYGLVDSYNAVINLIEKGLISPQFHAREHINYPLIERALQLRNVDLLKSMRVESMAGLDNLCTATADYTASFALDRSSDFRQIQFIMKQGLEEFHRLWTKSPIHFTPPAGFYLSGFDSTLIQAGIRLLDTPFKSYNGERKFKNIKFSWNGGWSDGGLRTVVRNCLFEPFWNPNWDWVDYTLSQIDAAISMGKIANISCHRVSFVGGIDEKVRNRGNTDLTMILRLVKKKWPEIKFIGSEDLLTLIDE